MLDALVSSKDKKSGESFQLRSTMGLRLSESENLRKAEDDLSRQYELFLNFEV